MKLFVIRHLPTDWNRAGLLQGQQDRPLLALDEDALHRVEQNRLLLHEHEPYDHVLASALRRTQATAVAYGYRFHVEPLLNELDFGCFEGCTRGELMAQLGAAWLDDPRSLSLGESIEEFATRLRAFVQRYAESQRVLVFGHGAWTRGMLSLAAYGDLRGLNHVALANNALVQIDVSQALATGMPERLNTKE